MSKIHLPSQSVYLGIIGLLLGFIIGFFYANHYNREAIMAGASGTTSPSASATAGTGQLPPDHPPIVSEQEISDAIKSADGDANNFDVQMASTQTLYRARRLDDVVRILQRALKLKPEDYQAMVQLGNVNYDLADARMQQGDSDGATPYFVEAGKWYERALQKNPKDVNVRTDYGLTYYFRKPQDLERAIAAYKQSLEVDPNHPQTLYNITIALTEKGDLSEAESTLARLSKIAPGAPILDRLRQGIEAKRSGTAGGPAPKPLSVK